MKYIFVLLDCFSKFCRIYPLTAATTLQCLTKVARYQQEVNGFETLLTDHGTQFTSKEWYARLKEMSIRPTHSSIRHPASNPVERVNREIGRILRTYCNQKHSSWTRYLPAMNELFNSVVHESTGTTPYLLHFGVENSDVWARLTKEDRLPEHEELMKYARGRMLYLAEKRKRRKVFYPGFRIGQLVLLRSAPTSDFFSKETKKLFLLFQGPYMVNRVIGRNAYQLWCERELKVKGVYNACNLKPYRVGVASVGGNLESTKYEEDKVEDEEKLEKETGRA